MKNIDIILPIVVGTVLFGLLITFVIYFILIYRKTQNKLDFERERLKSELLRVENEVKEQTLTNVSRELHDNFGQIASLIKINLNMVSKNLTPSDHVKIEESLSLLKQLIGDIKSLSSSLNGDHIRQLGWVEAVRRDVERINKMGGLQIEFTCEHWPALSAEKEVILYRILQEITNNSLKHAKATEAILQIANQNGETKIVFSDNGVGFDSREVKLGNGLKNIAERCKMIDAHVEFSAPKTGGSEICIIIA